ncbi:hypothetical protein HHI36_017132 [Cryptolaemus montrouzieri]|uniref:Uncharacterized protein n=1 Tax=Cryptolaemus montrouzieri TaxID=559131 RepID=A0ABD2NME3_9CUCU
MDRFIKKFKKQDGSASTSTCSQPSCSGQQKANKKNRSANDEVANRMEKKRLGGDIIDSSSSADSDVSSTNEEDNTKKKKPLSKKKYIQNYSAQWK